MKRAVVSFVILTSLTLGKSVFAEPFSSFKGGKAYAVEGRWLIAADHFIFKINEGTGNEESINLKKNAFNLGDKIKYQLCFKIQKDCQLNCEAEVLKEMRLIEPWQEAKVIVPNTKGTYPESTEVSCK